MDGSLPAPTPLPPIATPGGLIPPMQSGGFGGAPRPQLQPAPSGGAVGRPSGDPEVQQQRVERSAEQKRVESVLPKQVDSKLQVFKADRNGRIPFGNIKPLAIILLKDLEAAKGAGTETDEVIEAKLAEKGIQSGKFICRFVDRAGKPMSAAQFPPFDITIGDEESDDDMNDDQNEDEGQGAFMPQFQQQQAPPPTQLDLSAIARMQDGVREQEARRGSDMAALIASMQSSTNQMMSAMQQQAQQQAEALRREAADREQQAAARRSEFRTTLLAALPLVMPFITKMFGPKEHQADPTQAMLLELFKAKITEKPNDGTSAMEQLTRMLPEMMRSQIAIQAEGTKASMGVQSEVTGMLMKNLLGTMKDLMDNKKELAEPKDEGTIATVLKTLGPLLAGMAQQQPQQPQVTYQQPNPPQQTEQQAPAQTEAQIEQPVRRRKVQPPPPLPAQPTAADAPPAEKPRSDPTKYTDDSRIASCLDTVRRLSTGEVPANERFNALEWITKWAPPSMLAAIKAGSEDQVMAVGQTAVLASPVLLNWISTDGMVEFLKKAISDLKLLLDGTLTKEVALASVRENITFVQMQRTKNAGPPTGTIVKQAEVLPPSSPSAPPAPPAAAIPPAPRRRRSTPPADAPVSPPEPPAASGTPAQTPAADASSPTPPEPPAPTAGG